MVDTAHGYFGGTYWVTEFADTIGEVANDKILVDHFRSHSWIQRWAYFTNRAQGNKPRYPSEW
jgi:hypothetical protein